ncbi:MFS transporter [Paenibacillus sp. 1001270B_150601_E10]|uniref:MFS transporter n=1 Tax=Paenibacillus sp. 1001270B_150601_E10 TaxID=2787079 RepID=UPI0018A0A01C|nr:MFS transporter [Paenibacillus sp. 1001270B_150601_E10]
MADPALQEKKRIRLWLEHIVRSLKRPAPLTSGWKGASLALGAIALCLYLVQSYTLIGARGAIPYIVGTLVFLLAIVLLTGVIAMLLHWAKKMPIRYVWLALTAICLLFISFIGPIPLMFLASLSIIVAFSLLGMFVYRWKSGGYRESKAISNVLSFITAGISLVYILLGSYWLLESGNNNLSKPYRLQVMKPADRYPVTLSNPAEQGAYRVKTLTYGSANSYRKAFNAKDSLITKQVDGSSFVKNWSALRTKTFGFGPDAMALNGLVWYPDGDGPFPLVVAVHGNHLATDYSDPGYAYLGELLASKGYIFVSIDENFLNTSPYDDLLVLSVLENENSARGWLMLEHLKVWEEWNGTKGNPFYAKADMDRISLIGHSRGGEAVTVAAAYNKLSASPENGNMTFDYDFGIRSIISIAGTDGQYKPAGQPTALNDISYLSIHGAHDMDVSSFNGASQYSRIGFSGKSADFKASVYIYGANHGQFNTEWGRSDSVGIGSKLYNTAQLLPQEEQLQTAKVLISSFLDATLKEQQEYRSVFQDLGHAREWLPDTMYISNYWDSATKLISSFDEDIDLATTTLKDGRLIGEGLKEWTEEKVKMKYATDQYSAVHLGWNREDASGTPAYSVFLPEEHELSITDDSAIVFAMADRDDKKDTSALDLDDLIDLTIQAEDKKGNRASVPLSSQSRLLPMLEGNIMKWPFGFTVPTKEPVFQNFTIPLSELKKINPSFDPSELSKIRFVFDKTEKGTVLLRDIGIRDDKGSNRAAGS